MSDSDKRIDMTQHHIVGGIRLYQPHEHEGFKTRTIEWTNKYGITFRIDLFSHEESGLDIQIMNDKGGL